MAMTTKAYSLWVYDRHCTLIYHHDWSLAPSSFLQAGPDLLPGVSRCITQQPPSFQSSVLSQQQQQQRSVLTSASLTGSTVLALTDQAKLIYGLVFSLRNMLAKLSPSESASSMQAANKISHFNTYTTPTYALGHFQTASMYTFVLLTDPVSPPVRAGAGLTRGPTGTSLESSSSIAGAGGGIPGTGGMSLPGVLRQIAAGPWVEWVIKNPALDYLAGGVETEEMVDVDLDEEQMREDVATNSGAQRPEGEAGKNTADTGEDGDEDDDEGLTVKGRIERVTRRRGVDSDGFRGAVEAVLAQNKLSTSHSSGQRSV